MDKINKAKNDNDNDNDNDKVQYLMMVILFYKVVNFLLIFFSI